MYRNQELSYVNKSAAFSARREVEQLAEMIKGRQSKKAKEVLGMMTRQKHENELLDFRYHTDETILHIAAKYQNDGELTSKILHLCPNLILKARSCTQYAGQTSLHIAITKGNKRAFSEMISVASRSPKVLRMLLSTRATGHSFVNTVMMGELPLFVAALKFEREMVDKMIEIGAKIHLQNSKKDTIFHTLIKYAAIYPDKVAQVREMMEYLHDRLVQFSDERHEQKEKRREERRQRKQANERKESMAVETERTSSTLTKMPLPPLRGQTPSLLQSTSTSKEKSEKSLTKTSKTLSVGSLQSRSDTLISRKTTSSTTSSKSQGKPESKETSSGDTAQFLDPADRPMQKGIHPRQLPIKFAWKGDKDEPDDGVYSGDKDMPPKQMFSHTWFLKNNDSLTPLQLAAKQGITSLFEFILNIEDIYCLLSADDGLFDIKLYDITEIDSIANHKADLCSDDVDEENEIDQSPLCYGFPKHESVLEIMFDNHFHSSAAFELLELLPIKVLIQQKWDTYRHGYIFWMILHFLFMVYLSAYAVERSEIYFPSTMNKTLSDSYSHILMFVNVSTWISFAFGIFNFVVGILLLIPKFRRPNSGRYWKHNIGYIAMILILAIGLIVDALMTLAIGIHDGIPLIVALLIGWWFNVFFLRGWRVFSFFTVMIQQVIFGDMFRFSVFIFLELFAFTTCMHMVYQGKSIPSIEDAYGTSVGGNDNYLTTLMAMFNLMLGLDSIYTLNESRVPWMAVCLFIGFTLLTYVLLLNALIAMMSSTCGMVLENKYEQWRTQQLSVILLLEDLLYLCCIDKILKCPGNRKTIKVFNPVTMVTKVSPRYYLKMQSLQGEFATEEDAETIQKRAQTEINNTVNTELINTIKEGKFFVPKQEEKKPLLVSKQTETDGLNNLDLLEELQKPVVPVYHEFNDPGIEDSDEDEKRHKKALKEAEEAMIAVRKAGTGRIVFYEDLDNS